MSPVGPAAIVVGLQTIGFVDAYSIKNFLRWNFSCLVFLVESATFIDTLLESLDVEVILVLTFSKTARLFDFSQLLDSQLEVAKAVRFSLAFFEYSGFPLVLDHFLCSLGQ